MPRLSCWFVRASLVYLALGFTFGSLLLSNKAFPFYPAMWSLLPAHMEFLLVGWTVQLTLGVAYWILPRFGQGPPRGNEALARSTFLLLNLGVCLVIAPAVVSLSWLVPVGRLFEACAALIFLIAVWRRVKPFQT